MAVDPSQHWLSNGLLLVQTLVCHDDVIKWKHFPRNLPFVRGIHRFLVNSPHKGQWRGALMISLICVWLNDWVNNREAGDLRRYRAHYDVIVLLPDGTKRLFEPVLTNLPSGIVAISQRMLKIFIFDMNYVIIYDYDRIPRGLFW